MHSLDSKLIKDEFEDIKHLDAFALVNERRYNPFLFSLSKIEWALFGTLTWNIEALRTNSFNSESRRKSAFQNSMNQVSKNYRIRHKHLAYFRTTEYSPAGLGHFHFVLARKSIAWLDAANVADFIEKIWQENGTAEVNVAYTPTDSENFIKYACKPDYWNHSNEKFDYLSDGLKKLLRN